MKALAACKAMRFMIYMGLLVPDEIIAGDSPEMKLLPAVMSEWIASQSDDAKCVWGFEPNCTLKDSYSNMHVKCHKRSLRW